MANLWVHIMTRSGLRNPNPPRQFDNHSCQHRYGDSFEVCHQNSTKTTSFAGRRRENSQTVVISCFCRSSAQMVRFACLPLQCLQPYSLLRLVVFIPRTHSVSHTAIHNSPSEWRQALNVTLYIYQVLSGDSNGAISYFASTSQGWSDAKARQAPE
jgi:hypothetical protein